MFTKGDRLTVAKAPYGLATDRGLTLNALGLYLLISWHWDKSSTLADALTVSDLLSMTSTSRSATLEALGELADAGYIACVTPERLSEEITRQEEREQQRRDRSAEQERERMRNLPRSKLYVIGGQQDSGVIKIGVSIDPERRRDQLQIGSSLKLQVLWTHDNGSKRLEQWLHQRFAKYRTHNEWFDFGRRKALPLVQDAVSRWREAG
ncbi:T5orf172 domain-containing protein [Saccharopolyspora shandongensis]|uniref:T5orf172 domain-containing protein n=1 Tax=Saccharopolyspora shandongensis TaxID=418495 RepID=A0A1H3S8Z2_9PSEU|nr:T5orf172 domain-containing protein [Saccharopolyspora shandongensis]